MASIVLNPVVTPRIDVRIAVGLGLAAAIAWNHPFDRVFDALTLGQPVLRALAIIIFALAGLEFAGLIGLRVAPRNEPAPLLFPVLVALVVAVACAAVDAAFRPVLHPDYVQFVVATPLVSRVIGFTLRAFNESVIYRLFLGSALSWGLGRVWRRQDGAPRREALWVGFTVSQMINVWANVTSRAPLGALVLVHDLAGAWLGA